MIWVERAIDPLPPGREAHGDSNNRRGTVEIGALEIGFSGVTNSFLKSAVKLDEV